MHGLSKLFISQDDHLSIVVFKKSLVKAAIKAENWKLFIFLWASNVGSHKHIKKVPLGVADWVLKCVLKTWPMFHIFYNREEWNIALIFYYK